jgi:hypothetical protein
VIPDSTSDESHALSRRIAIIQTFIGMVEENEHARALSGWKGFVRWAARGGDG